MVEFTAGGISHEDPSHHGGAGEGVMNLIARLEKGWAINAKSLPLLAFANKA